jgi:Zn finger protein HypA/HybF involved in hydrogenase expression
VSRLSRQCGSLDISEPYRPPRPVTGIGFLVTVEPIALVFCLGISGEKTRLEFRESRMRIMRLDIQCSQKKGSLSGLKRLLLHLPEPHSVATVPSLQPTDLRIPDVTQQLEAAQAYCLPSIRSFHPSQCHTSRFGRSDTKTCWPIFGLFPDGVLHSLRSFFFETVPLIFRITELSSGKFVPVLN